MTLRLRRAATDSVPRLVAELLRDHPVHAVDVGAARGLPGHWVPYIDHLRVEAFEPRQDECARLANRSHAHVRWHPVCLAGKSGTRTLHVLRTPTGSSLYPPDDRFAALYSEPSYIGLVRTVSVDCVTLGGHLEQQGVPDPLLIKLDTQGSELEILHGLSSGQLAAVQAIEVEAEFHAAYAGQPLFADLLAFLTGQGFELLDMRTQRAYLTGGREPNHYLKTYLGTAVGTARLSAKLHAADALFVRPFTEVASSVTIEGLARYLTVLQIYQFYDVIFWMLDQPQVGELLGEADLNEVRAQYAAAAPRPTLSQRTGPIPHLVRRARRAASILAERSLGSDGFDPPRTFWSHSYWPDQ